MEHTYYFDFDFRNPIEDSIPVYDSTSTLKTSTLESLTQVRKRNQQIYLPFDQFSQFKCGVEIVFLQIVYRFCDIDPRFLKNNKSSHAPLARFASRPAIISAMKGLNSTELPLSRPSSSFWRRLSWSTSCGKWFWCHSSAADRRKSPTELKPPKVMDDRMVSAKPSSTSSVTAVFGFAFVFISRPPHPTLPSRLTAISFWASTANSMGSCCSTSRTKPLTTSATASSSDRPRDTQ